MPFPKYPYRWMRRDVWRDAPGRIMTVLVSYPTQPIELFAGIGSILRGVWWMLADADMVSLTLEKLLPIHGIGAGLVLLGLVQILGVALRSESLRRVSAALIVGGTALILTTTLMVDPTNRTIPSIALTVLMEILVVIRVGPWTDFPFAAKRNGEPPPGGIIGIKIMAATAAVGAAIVLAQQTASHVSAAGMWAPVLITSAGTVVALLLNNYFQTRRTARRADLQAPVRELKLVQLVQDEGEQIRKELRVELEYKAKETERLRALLDLREKHIHALDERLLLCAAQTRECQEENVRLRAGMSGPTKGTS